MRSACFAVLLLIGTLRCAVAQETAMLFFTSGPVETKVQNSGWKPARSLQRLKAQDQVRCAAGGQAGIVILASGARFKVAEGTTATVQDGTVLGAKSLGQIGGLSARAAGQLAGSRSGAIGSRGPVKPQDIVYKFPGWLAAGTRTFSWADPLVFQLKSSAYAFTLFDLQGNVLWSVRTTMREATVPNDVLDFKAGDPYIWRLNGISRLGAPSGNYIWGFVTFLPPDEGAKLQASIAELQRTLDSVMSAQPEGPEQKSAQQIDERYLTVLIANLYRQHGVLMGAYNTWYREPAYSKDSEDFVMDLGRLARLFLGKPGTTEGN